MCSLCCLNVVFIRKKDNMYRFCVDYRLMNEVIVWDVYFFFRIDECLDFFSGMKWFSYFNVNFGMVFEDIEKIDVISFGLY